MNSLKATFSTLKEIHREDCCSDKCDDIVVVKIDKLPDHAIRLVDFNVFVFCRYGRCEVEINDELTEIDGPSVYYIGQYSCVDHVAVDSEYNGIAICFTHDMLSRYFLRNKDMWSRLRYLEKNRLILFPNNLVHLQIDFYDIFSHLVEDGKDRLYYENIVDGAFRSFLYCQLSNIPEPSSEKGLYKQSESLVMRFLDLVKEDEAVHRDLKYYADVLCVSAKHLTAMCKRTLGKSAHKIIEEETLSMVKYYLYSTTLTVKQIADKMNFCSLSFFGKFVRDHLGKTPSEVRKEMGALVEDVSLSREKNKRARRNGAPA